MTRLAFIRDRITFARWYTTRLLDTTDPADWFRVPPAGVSHLAWQVGHLAMAEYRLALERIRGRQPADEGLIAPAFLAAFGRDSRPSADASQYPHAAEIRRVFDRVHDQVLRELLDLPDAELDAPVLTPHAFARTKGDALLWCAHHEGVHAGQIGLLRRQLGAPPVW